jgi:hypothetical protein
MQRLCVITVSTILAYELIQGTYISIIIFVILAYRPSSLGISIFVYNMLNNSKYNYNGQVKEDEMDRACSTNGGEEECI